MASEVSDIAKQGYVRTRSRTLGLWQRRWIVFRRASSKGPSCLEKYLDERSARTSGSTHKVAPLTNVVSVMRLTSNIRKHAFSLAFQDGTAKLIACDSDLEADTWVKLLIQECLLPQPGLATGEPDVLSPGIQKELQEQFHVYLMPTPKLEVFGECLLQVTHENIYLWDISNPRLKLVAWPLTALRRYGSDPTKFTFEAGRHCATGEGMFVFHTLEGEKIYRKVHQATLTIAEAHHRMRKGGGTPVGPESATTVCNQQTTPIGPTLTPSPRRSVHPLGTPLHMESEWRKGVLAAGDGNLAVSCGTSNVGVMAPSSLSLSSSPDFHLEEELTGPMAHLSCSLPSQDSLLSLPPHHPRGTSAPSQGSVELPRRLNTPKCSLRSHLISCNNNNTNSTSNSSNTTNNTSNTQRS